MEEVISMSKAVYLSELETNIIPEPPEKDPDAVSLSMRFPDGKMVKRRFWKSSTLNDVMVFCKVHLNQIEDLKLICSYPRKPYTDMQMLVGVAFPSDSTVFVQNA